MPRFYQPDITSNFDNQFMRDGEEKWIRRSYWLDMNDHTLVMAMTKGIGANLTNDEKRAHLIDLRRKHLVLERGTSTSERFVPAQGRNYLLAK